ncbi:argininosuccinate synthase [Condylostylus longicornis]|uniref:argininosuccinate synthase n=1 Tax=Condylostylus longicornis TaxID=2530218 RepID=UPI00244E5240|nr:argininosuccinate synthase [Condylostylus longicornis]
MAEKVVLAYSGGLDTSCILKWLLEKGYEVYCFMADVGQNENFLVAVEKALKIGAKDVIISDIKSDFVNNYIWPAIQMGLIYEERYLLGTSLARPCIATELIKIAKKLDAKYISHGATGKGNDQVRFEICSMALHPEIKIIAPWRDEEFCKKFQGRKDLLDYAKKHNIPVSATPKEPWSTDANIMHISYESGILENPKTVAPDHLYEMTKNFSETPNYPYHLEIHFNVGLPTKVKDLKWGKTYENNVEILKFLNEIGGTYGIGRIDIVENRYVGLKSRGIYETPGASILFKAHQDLELFCLDREVYRLKSYLRDRMADYVYNGYWFSPEADYTKNCLKLSQKTVDGVVVIELRSGFCRVIARESKKSLYNQELVSMDVHGNYKSEDATGFININAVRIKQYYKTFHNDDN